MGNKKLCIVLFFLICCNFLNGQDSINYKSRKIIFITSSACAVTGSYIGFNELWYKKSSKTKFHFIDDFPNWKQMDKLGHAYGAYQFTRIQTQAGLWAGLDTNKAVLIGGLTGLLLQTPLEILDGHAKDFGASYTDFTANVIGIGLFTSQKLLWKEERVLFKFSTFFTDFARLRPETLGESRVERVFKDYNGQKYWFSVDLNKFGCKSNVFKWLQPSLGYGASGMVYATDSDNNLNGYANSYRRWYFSIDFNWDSLKSRSKFVNTLLFCAKSLKIPAPALLFENKTLKFKTLVF